MQELHEFRWTDDETEGDRHLDLRMIESEDGTYTIQNLAEPSEVYEAKTPQEAVTQFTSLFEKRR